MKRARTGPPIRRLRQAQLEPDGYAHLQELARQVRSVCANRADPIRYAEGLDLKTFAANKSKARRIKRDLLTLLRTGARVAPKRAPVLAFKAKATRYGPERRQWIGRPDPGAHLLGAYNDKRRERMRAVAALYFGARDRAEATDGSGASDNAATAGSGSSPAA